MKLAEIQKKLAESKTEAYLVTHGNRFLGQDILSGEHKLKHLCGFSGSAGLLAITEKSAFLFVDGRYELQARQETDSAEITVVDENPVPENAVRFLTERNIRRIGYDGWCVSETEIRELREKYPETEFADLGDFVEIDNAGIVKVCEREVKYSGESREEKILRLQKIMRGRAADYWLLTSADSISWLLNIYARDLPYSPVVRAYALLSADGNVTLLGNNLQTKFSHKNMAEMPQFLGGLKGKILYSAAEIPSQLLSLLPSDIVGENISDVCQDYKARKNPTELQGMINCHIRDGVALSGFLCWLDKNRQGLTELDVVHKLHEFRAAQTLFFSESFATIAGAAEHGAVVHYEPEEKTNIPLKENSLLLLDSGAQYYDGTTDVTRTVAIGEPSAEMKKMFTLVLKSHIALAAARFPKGTAGVKLDALAREPLWRAGLDFKHGTGHGVACFGNVHEGPQRIAAGGSLYGFQASMVTSIEPGVYLENRYGIRIENLAYTAEVPDCPEFLEFKYLTLVPIDKRLIEAYLLEQGERDWLNAYHHQVYESLAAYVNDEEKKWLKEACSPL